MLFRTSLTLWSRTKCTWYCCVFEHIAHDVEGGGVEGGRGGLGYNLPQITVQALSSQPLLHLVYQIRPTPVTISSSYMVLLHYFSESCYLIWVGGPWAVVVMVQKAEFLILPPPTIPIPFSLLHRSATGSSPHNKIGNINRHCILNTAEICRGHRPPV